VMGAVGISSHGSCALASRSEPRSTNLLPSRLLLVASPYSSVSPPPTRLAALVARASRRGGGGSNLDMVGVVSRIWVPLVVTLVGAAEGGM
jgi:hypothetical protein